MEDLTDYSKIYEEVYSYLGVDLCDIGFFIQMVDENSENKEDLSKICKEVLSYLLEHGVEIGQIGGSPEVKYTKFTAWRGSVSERIERAWEIRDVDNGYSTWLCLHENIDEYEY